MKGNKDILAALNEVLMKELTAINQYFLHARMLENWGLGKIGKYEYKASITEMKHADKLIKRVLFLEGLPNLQKLGKLKIGQTVKEIIDCDLIIEQDSVAQLKKYIDLCEKETDFVTRDLLTDILQHEEDHIDWMETQIDLIQSVGEENYQQSQMVE